MKIARFFIIVRGGCARRNMFKELPHIFLKSVESTNTLASERFSESGGEGFILQAQTQTKGRGRQGRIWHQPMQDRAGDQKEDNLYVTFVFPEKRSLQEAVSFHPFFWSVVLYQTIELFIPLNQRDHLKLKWPNDLLWKNRKMAGILIETTHYKETFAVIVGIGVNIHTVPEGFEDKACSLKEAMQGTEKIPSAFELTRAMMGWAETFYEAFSHTHDYTALYKAWTKRAAFIGESVQVRHHQHFITGTMQGLSPQGALEIMDEGGKCHTLWMVDDLTSEKGSSQF
jgi:BirA family transcriptional regulator, biotin operon repressor / biotin---[acetyl-CoA-carboxylase] ligase